MVVALTTEHAWDFGLLGINMFALLIGIPVARAFATSNNTTFRWVWPIFALSLLGVFAAFIFWARYYVK